MFPRRSSQARFPRAGPKRLSEVLRNRSPSKVPKVPRKRFRSNIPRNRFPKFPRVPKIGFEARFQRAGSQAKFLSKSSEAKLPGTDLQARCPGTGVQARFFVSDRWLVKGLSRFISNSFQISFRQAFVDFCHVVVAVGDIVWAYCLFNEPEFLRQDITAFSH